MTTKEDIPTTPWIIVAAPSYFKDLKRWDVVKERYHVVDWEYYLQHEEEYAEKIEAMAVMSGGKSIINENNLKKMKNLKLFHTWSKNTELLDLLRKYNIKIGDAPRVSIEGCANLAMTLLLAAARRLPENIAEVKSGSLDSTDPWKIPVGLMGKGVTGANLGIVGMGIIGFEVAKRARAFGMNILYHNRNQRSKEDEMEVLATYCSTIEALIPQADFLMLLASLTPSSRHIMNKETFKLMKPDSIFINVGRGALVNHDDLVEALTNGTIASAALDVTDPAPLPNDHALMKMRNVIITPTMSCCTTNTLETMLQIVIDNIHAAGI